MTDDVPDIEGAAGTARKRDDRVLHVQGLSMQGRKDNKRILTGAGPLATPTVCSGATSACAGGNTNGTFHPSDAPLDVALFPSSSVLCKADLFPSYRLPVG